MHPDRLLRQCQFLEDHLDRGGFLPRPTRRRPSQARRLCAHIAWVNSLLEPGEIKLRRFVESPVAHPSVMFRRALLQEHGGYASGDFPEDYELWLRWMEAGVEFSKVNADLLICNDPPGRLSRADQRYRAEAFYRIKCLYLAHWLKKEVASFRGVWLWGAGRVTRRRFGALEEQGIAIRGSIDVDVKKIGRSRGGRLQLDLWTCLRRLAFVLVGVAVRGRASSSRRVALRRAS
jgi:hypothetical protein